MNPHSLLALLAQIREGTVSPEEGVTRLSDLPYEEMGFAKIDHHRALRTGMPEVIYGAGKTDRQVVEIFDRMVRNGGNVLATRVGESAAAAVLLNQPAAVHHAIARTVSLRQQDQRPASPRSSSGTKWPRSTMSVWPACTACSTIAPPWRKRG
jgi:NCAIR mutase (PurE)-related protein